MRKEGFILVYRDAKCSTAQGLNSRTATLRLTRGNANIKRATIIIKKPSLIIPLRLRSPKLLTGLSKLDYILSELSAVSEVGVVTQVLGLIISPFI